MSKIMGVLFSATKTIKKFTTIKNAIIIITKGTPQGGFISLLFFVISLDLILKEEGLITSRILRAVKYWRLQMTY